MKNIIKLLIFLIYTILIFFVKNYIIILLITLINILAMLILKINIRDAIYNFLRIFWFILFTAIINMIFSNITSGILIGIRLILVCNITYTFSKIFTYTELAKTIEDICTPLKIFKIDTHQIGLIICIAVAFIPILQEEIVQIRSSLKSKGNNNVFMAFQPFLVNLFKRVNQIEEALQAKAWN